MPDGQGSIVNISSIQATSSWPNTEVCGAIFCPPPPPPPPGGQHCESFESQFEHLGSFSERTNLDKLGMRQHVRAPFEALQGMRWMATTSYV